RPLPPPIPTHFPYTTLFRSYAPANRSDLPLQRSYAGFTRILLNNSFNRLMSDFYLLIRKPVFFNLFGHQMSFSNLRFFLQRVSADIDNFHTVAQRGRDGIQRVGRSDKEYFGEVIFQLQIVIGKAVILLRIQYFQQAGGGVATIV